MKFLTGSTFFFGCSRLPTSVEPWISSMPKQRHHQGSHPPAISSLPVAGWLRKLHMKKVLSHRAKNLESRICSRWLVWSDFTDSFIDKYVKTIEFHHSYSGLWYFLVRTLLEHLGPTKTPWKPYTNPTQTLCISLSLPRACVGLWWELMIFVIGRPQPLWIKALHRLS